MKTLINISLLLLLAFFFSSCFRERGYRLQVANKTDYHINKMTFKADEQTVLSVNPNSISEEFIISIKLSTFSLSEPLLSVRINEYSDTSTTYENKIGQVISIEKLNKKDVNNVSIELKPNSLNEEYQFIIFLDN